MLANIAYPYIPKGRAFKFTPLSDPFMTMAKAYAETHSLDKHYPNASIMVKNGKIIGMGANGSDYHDNHGCKRKELGIPTGQGYDLCEGCHPKNHSEPAALKDAAKKEHDAEGADIYLWGHWWCCEPCWQQMIAAGIRDVYLMEDAHNTFTKEAKKRIIFGIVGHIGSGKGAAAAYLESRYGAGVYRSSNILRDVLDRLHEPHKRKSLQELCLALCEQFGEDILSKTMRADIEQLDQSIMVVEGIRREGDFAHIKDAGEFVLVSIDADTKVRYNRLISRGENVDDNKSFEDFLEDSKRGTELNISKLSEQATEHIHNNGDFAALYAQIDQLVETYAGTR
ncbi:MAG: hypothetical protein HOE53_00935 [Candidatus Magasanikbacteria bacterium]|jgi:dephospho-CoA kinase/deoxycytidylate deaminase|nr:hypothetical protein [Candidatus Magasanikbacteria bacterium]